MARLGFSYLGLLFWCALLAGCNDEDGGRKPTSSSTPSDVPKPGEYLTIEPGEPTICSKGTPFRFFVAGGDPKKIIVDFRGGGACWSPVTCLLPIFSPEAPTEENARKFIETAPTGIYRLGDERNPMKDWTLIHVPYCTADVHWGDAVVDYSPDLRIHHKGFVNAQAVLSWIFERYDPEEVYITGCSAGAYGAIGHAPYIADRYPKAKIRMVADSGCGIVSDTFFKESFPNWNAQVPQVGGLVGRDILTLTIVDLYTEIAKAYPNVRFAEQTSAFDKDQTRYYTTMGGDPEDWSPTMMKSLTDISAGAPENYRYYVSPGQVHCLQPYDAFYDRVSDGTKYLDWLGDFMDAETTPESVACSGAACKQDPICDSCKAGERTGGECDWCEGWTGQ